MNRYTYDNETTVTVDDGRSVTVKPVDRRFPSGRACVAELRSYGYLEGHVMTDIHTGRCWIDNTVGHIIGSRLDVMNQNALAAEVVARFFPKENV